MEFRRFSLSNGIRVVVAPMTRVSTVALQVWLSCGSRGEQDHEAGLAHMNEHMFFRGGRDFPDSKRVDRELWLLGESYNAFTDYEHVIYFIITSPHFLARAAHLLSDMLIHARFDAECFETAITRLVVPLKKNSAG
ncbi:MAG: insulinase family protein [Candidatus Sungbacteria bacterium]|nr:insulinase family protein [Candidatus Sungbacteria bacterium]